MSISNKYLVVGLLPLIIFGLSLSIYKDALSYISSPNQHVITYSKDFSSITHCLPDRFDALIAKFPKHLPPLRLENKTLSIDMQIHSNTPVFSLPSGKCFQLSGSSISDSGLVIRSYKTKLPPLDLAIGGTLLSCLLILTVIPKKPFRLFAFWFLLIFIGFTIRWQRLPTVLPYGAEPDAHSYLSLAQSITGPLGTQSREPLFVLWLHPLVNLGVNPEFINRLGTIVLSVLCVSVAFLVFSKRLSIWTGVFIGLFLAIHPMSINLSVRGMRDELVTLLTLLFFYHFSANNFQPNRLKFLFMGVLAGLLAVTRLETLSFCLILFFVVLLRVRHKIISFLLFAIPVLLIVSPYLYHNYHLYKDPFYPSTLHATWFRNYEFLLVKKTGCAGCPTLADYPKGSAGGTRISGLTYLFSYHSPPEILSKISLGTSYLLTLRHNAIVLLGLDNILTHLVYLTGLMVLLIRQKLLLALMPLFLTNVLVFFIATDGFLDTRVLANILPFVGLIIWTGIYYILRLINHAFSR